MLRAESSERSSQYAMKVRNIALTAGAFLLGTVGTFVALWAQGPMYDKVIVDLPYSVTVRDTTLQPGQYVIQQLPSESSNRVVQIFSNDGMKLETTVITVPALENKTQDKTEVLLHHFGNDYYFDKVWIQGKDYGYEFPLPNDVKSRENERGAAVTIGAKYESASGEATAQAPQPSTASSQAPESAAAQPPAATEQPSTTESAANQPSTSQPSAAPRDQEPEAQLPAETATSGNTPSQDSQAMAQAQPPAAATGDDISSANTEAGSRNREMPKTASNWLVMLLTGCALSATGIALRRVTA
jgi:hypothetical protein